MATTVVRKQQAFQEGPRGAAEQSVTCHRGPHASPLCLLRGCAKVPGICLKRSVVQKGSLNLQCLLRFLHVVPPSSGWHFSIVFPEARGEKRLGTRKGFARGCLERPCQRVEVCLCLGLLAEVGCPTGRWWTRCAGSSGGGPGLSRRSAGQGAMGSSGLGIEQSCQLDVGLSLLVSCNTALQMKHHLAMTSPKR